jgi:hypothetical protein
MNQIIIFYGFIDLASTGSAKGKTRSLSLSKGAGWLSN